jgi:hypothetical protein
VSGYVTPELADLIASTALALGVSRSSLVEELLRGAVPVLELMGDLGRTLQEAPERHREALVTLADALRPMTEELRQQLDALPVLPPPSNTGVRNG